MKHRIVRRPMKTWSRYPIAELIRTTGTRNAVRIELNGKRRNTVVSNLLRVLRKQGYQLRYRADGQTAIVAWVDPIKNGAA
jgi:hypothetical protein